MWRTTTISSMLAVAFCVSTAVAAPPLQESVVTVLGPKAYRDGDVVEITDVTATSPRLEQGDSVTVRGRYRLESRPQARLCLYVTQTEGDGHEEVEAAQRVEVTEGSGEFELKTTIKHRGVLHVTFYDFETGQPLGGTYFGTADQMQKIAAMDVSYYLKDAANENAERASSERRRPRRRGRLSDLLGRQ